MATLAEQLQKAKSVNEQSIKNDLFRFIKTIEKYILEKEKIRIFDKSQDIHGKALGYYSAATEIISKGKKKKDEPFTAFETGDLFKGFFMQEVSGVLRFGSTSPHLADILKSSGSWLSKDFLGLSDEDLKAIIEEKLLPFLLQYIRKKLDV
jgi:uncharacterized protein (UPF0335 family)